MNLALATAGVLLVAVCSSASAATSSAGASKQRVAIEVRGSDHTFALTPLTPGALGPDSGTESGCCWSDRWIMRDGQRIEINDPLVTFAGKHGVLEVRYRIEWVDAGHGYSVGTATWRVVGGRGVYRRLTGSGRSAYSWPSSGLASGLSEGFLVKR